MPIKTFAYLAFTAAIAANAPTANVKLSDDLVSRTIRTIASPAFEGRMTLSPGGVKAGDYLARQFKAFGLKPGGDDKSYFYQFPVTFQFRPTKNNSLSFTLAGGETVTLKIDRDYRPLVNSTKGQVDAPVVFAGFGIEDENWNDYKDLDVKGKVVMVFRGIPDGQYPTSTGSKAQLAAEKGAVGIIVVGPNAPGRAELPNYSRGQGMPPQAGLAGAGIRSSLFKKLTGMDYAQTRAMTAPASRLLNLKCRLQAELEPNSGQARDVVGVLPGHDPKLKSEYIIIGAHYDHLGYGETGSMTGTDAIHPGADDNGSGTTGVVALAEYFARTKSNKRTLIFQLYQGEELGLLGSDAWAKNHQEMLKKTTAMLNMDMIGRLRENSLEIYGTSTAKEWDSVLSSLDAGSLKLKLTPASRPDSDHASFTKYGVPILFFFTGMHPEYHTERDTVETLNIPGIATVAAYVGQVAQAVDALPSRLTYQAPAMASRGGDRANAQGRRIRIGFVPDMSDTGKGVLLSGVSPGSPAEKAGFKAGDRIMEFNGHKLDDLQALADAMVGSKPGDRIKVVFVRDGKEQQVELVAEASKG